MVELVPSERVAEAMTVLSSAFGEVIILFRISVRLAGALPIVLFWMFWNINIAAVAQYTRVTTVMTVMTVRFFICSTDS